MRKVLSLILISLALPGAPGCIVVGSDGELSFFEDSSSVFGDGALGVDVPCDPGGVPFGGGTGSAGDPYAICSPAQFWSIELASTSNFILAQDIDMSAASVTEYVTSLSGSVDGNYKTISNLNFMGSDTYGGLFGVIASGAVVQRLAVVGANVTLIDGAAGQSYGVIAGVNGGTITDVYVSAQIHSTSSDSTDFLAGIVGTNYGSGVVSNAEVIVSNSTAGTSMVHTGGIVGLNDGTVDQSTVNVSLDHSSNSSAVHGGVVARNSSTGIVSNVTVSGYLSGLSTLGGVVGENFGRIQSSTSDASIYGESDTLGGIAGVSTGNGSPGQQYGVIDSCTVTASAYVYNSGFSTATGGLVGRLNIGGTLRFSTSFADVNSAGTGVGGAIGDMMNGYSAAYSTHSYGNVSGDPVFSSQVGGFVGYMSISAGGYIGDVSASGNVSGNDFIGGLVGWVSGTGSAEDIRDSWATGSVSATIRGGGLVGFARNAWIIRSYASNNIYALDLAAPGNYFGGIVGEIEGSAMIRDSYSHSSLFNITNDPDNYFGGIVGRATYLSSFYPTLEQSYFAGNLLNSSGVSLTPGGYDAVVVFRDAGVSISNVYFDAGALGGTSVQSGVVPCSTSTMTDGTNATCEVGLPAGLDTTSPWVFLGGSFPQLYWQ